MKREKRGEIDLRSGNKSHLKESGGKIMKVLASSVLLRDV